MHSEVVAVLVNCLAIVIGLTSSQINWPIADWALRMERKWTCGHWELLCGIRLEIPGRRQINLAREAEALTQLVRKPPSGPSSLYRTLGKPEAAASSLARFRRGRISYRCAASQSRNLCTRKPAEAAHTDPRRALRFPLWILLDLSGPNPSLNARYTTPASLYASAT
jgi:hypothetical protein